MAKRVKTPQAVENALPEFARIELSRILEPEMPARSQMSDAAMQDLVASLAAIGQIEPITVERCEGMFEIITGHRRFLAARELKWDTLAALIYPEGESRVVAMRLHENAVREDLNPAEEALWMAQVREQLALDEAGLCAAFKRSEEYIASRFALLRGDPEIFGALQRGEIRLGVAHELNRIGDESMRRYYLTCAVRSDPPARVVRQWVADWKAHLQPTMEGAIEAARASVGDAGVPSGEPGANGGNRASVNAPGPGEPGFFGCGLCGGTRDPSNLISVMIHKWEWEHIQEQLRKVQRGE